MHVFLKCALENNCISINALFRVYMGPFLFGWKRKNNAGISDLNADRYLIMYDAW